MIEKHVKICRDLRMNLVAIFQKNIMIQKLDILVFSLGKKPMLRVIQYQDIFPRQRVKLATSIQRSLIATSMKMAKNKTTLTFLVTFDKN